MLTQPHSTSCAALAAARSPLAAARLAVTALGRSVRTFGPSLLAFALLAGCAASTSTAKPRRAEQARERVTEAPSEPEAAEAPEASTLELWAAEPTEVRIDGESVGTTPIAKLPVEPGRHDVTFVDPESGNATLTIDVEPGEHQRVKAPARRAHVRELAPAPAAQDAGASPAAESGKDAPKADTSAPADVKTAPSKASTPKKKGK